MEQEYKKPVLGITIGDLNGIGPEVIMKVFADDRLLNLCICLLYTSDAADD